MANMSLISFPTPHQHGGHPLLSASLHVSRLHNCRSGHQRRRIQERTKPKHPIPSSEGRYQNFWFGENGCSMPCLPPSKPPAARDKLFPLSLSLPAPQRDHCYACAHGRFTWVPMAHGAGLKQQLVSNSLDVHHSEDRSLDTATTEDFTQDGKSHLSNIRLSPNISQTVQTPQTGSMLNDDMKNFTSESLLASVTEPHGHVIYDFETYWTESELLEKSDSSSAWDQSNEKSAETLSLQLTSPPDIPTPRSHPFPSPTNSTQSPCHAISSSPRSTISQGNGTYRLKYTSQNQDTYTLDTQADNINPTVGSFTSDNLLDISPGLQTNRPVSEPQVLEESMTKQEEYVREGQEMGLNEYHRVSIDPKEIPLERSTGHISPLALQRKHESQNVKPKAVVGDSPIMNSPISVKAPGSKSFTNFPKRSTETVTDVTDQLPNRGNFWDVDIETLILEDEGGESLTDTEYDENQCSHSGVEHNVTYSHHKDSLGLEEPDLCTNSVTAWSDVTDPICHHNNPESGTQALNHHPYKSPKDYASDGYQSDILGTTGYQSHRANYTEVISHSFDSTGSLAHKPESGSDSDIEAVSLLHSSDFKDSAESRVKDPTNQNFPSSDMVKIKRKYLRECHVEGNIAKADTQDISWDKAVQKPDLYFLHPDVVAERVIERYKIDASTALRMTERNDTFTQQYREKMAQRRLSLPSMKPRKLQPLIDPPYKVISPTRRHSHQPYALHLTERSLDIEETWLETPEGHDIP